MSNRKSSRRSFLQGRAAIDALADVTHGINAEQSKEELAKRAKQPPGFLLEFSRRAMACEFVIYLNPGQHKKGPELATEAFDFVDWLEAQMTVYRPDSELSLLNARAYAEAVSVEQGLFQLLERGVQIHRQTVGCFDMTAGPLSQVWGFSRRQGEVPSDEAIADALRKVGSDKLEMNDDDLTIRFAESGMQINLGGIGKGYALDQVAESLVGGGVKNFLFHGGHSSVTARGGEAGKQGWRVGLRDPLRPEIRFGEFTLNNNSLATSGSGAQHFFHKGKKYGHILDPRTGRPADTVLSSTVITQSAADADAFATACYVAGLEGVHDICRQRPDLSVLLLTLGKRAGTFEQHRFNLSNDVFEVAGAN